MSNDYYNPSGSPGTSSPGASATMRGEFLSIAAGFALLPGLAGNGDLPVFVNSGASALTSVTAVSARSKLGLGTIATQNANNVAITGGNISGLTSLSTNNVTLTGGSFTNATELQSNNLQATGGAISGITATSMLEVATNNAQITGGSISGLATLGTNNATITGGSVSANILSVTTANNSLAGDVFMLNSVVVYNGPSLSLGNTGTWWIEATTQFFTSGSAAFPRARLWDGNNVIASGEQALNSTVGVDRCSIHLSGKLTNPTGNVVVSAQDGTSTNTVIKFNTSGYGQDTVIFAKRLG